jgi:hypothetical protein
MGCALGSRRRRRGGRKGDSACTCYIFVAACVSRRFGGRPKMLDRAIGILGIALAVIFGLYSLAPADWLKPPVWVTLAGIGVGVFLTGLAGGMLLSEFRQSDSPKTFIWNPDPPTVLVENRTFTNERVLLDGRIYRNCRFENVTFVYNGTQSLEVSNSNIVGRYRVASDNPAVEGTIGWLAGLGALSSQFEFRGNGRIQPPRRAPTPTPPPAPAPAPAQP